MPIVRRIWLTIIIVCLGLGGAVADARTVLTGEQGTPAPVLRKVTAGINMFDQLTAATGYSLHGDVKVYVCPTSYSYRAVLRREFKFNAATVESYDFSSGLTVPERRTVVLKFDASQPRRDEFLAFRILPHELFHLVQNELAGPNIEKAPKWLREGTADYIGATVADKAGYQSKANRVLECIEVLRRDQDPVAPQELLRAGTGEWANRVERRDHPYETADLMVMLLAERMPGHEAERFTEYFRLLGQGRPADECFVKAFGITPDRFLAAFQTWYDQMVK